MGLSKINLKPRMTLHLVNKVAFDKRKLVVVDVGARGGGEQHWDVYGDQLILIGFEPDEAECKTLNEKFGGKGHRYFPVALHRDKGERPFYITEFDASSGFYKNDMTFWSRFPEKVYYSVKETVSMETIDFMKLDVEGAELDILEGSTKYLRKGLLLGAAIEVRFFDFAKQPVFSDIDSFMRRMGFKLFDLEFYRRAREALPEAEDYIGAPTKRGQVILADTLYLRDAVAEIEAANAINWDDISILKLASLFEVYGLPDCAIELLQAAGKNNFLKGRDIGHLVDLLTPQFEGRDITYLEYLQNIKTGKKQEEPSLQEESSLPEEPSLKDILWRDIKLIVARCLPAPVKRFIKRTILRT